MTPAEEGIAAARADARQQRVEERERRERPRYRYVTATLRDADGYTVKLTKKYRQDGMDTHNYLAVVEDSSGNILTQMAGSTGEMPSLILNDILRSFRRDYID